MRRGGRGGGGGGGGRRGRRGGGGGGGGAGGGGGGGGGRVARGVGGLCWARMLRSALRTTWGGGGLWFWSGWGCRRTGSSIVGGCLRRLRARLRGAGLRARRRRSCCAGCLRRCWGLGRSGSTTI